MFSRITNKKMFTSKDHESTVVTIYLVNHEADRSKNRLLKIMLDVEISDENWIQTDKLKKFRYLVSWPPRNMFITLKT